MAERSENGQFAKGTSGNPAGRPPKEQCLSHLLAQAGDEAVSEADPRTRKQALAEKIWDLAIGGDWTAINLLMNRLDGPLPLLGGEGKAKVALILDDTSEGL